MTETDTQNPLCYRCGRVIASLDESRTNEDGDVWHAQCESGDEITLTDDDEAALEAVWDAMGDVDPEDACPNCGNVCGDDLDWSDDLDEVRCMRCDSVFRPGRVEPA